MFLDYNCFTKIHVCCLCFSFVEICYVNMKLPNKKHEEQIIVQVHRLSAKKDVLYLRLNGNFIS